MGADIENEINKIRWERWRAKQKTEREKTCFYCWEGVWINWNVNWFDWDGVWLDWPNWKQWGDWGSDWSDFCSNACSCHAGCCVVEVNADFDRGTCKLRVGVIAAFCLQRGYNSNHCGNTMCGRASVFAVAIAVSGSWVGCQGNWDCGYWCPGINEEVECTVPPDWCGYSIQAHAKGSCTCGLLPADECEVSCTVG